MPETIVDSKFRILGALPKLAGRDRYLASDLISSQGAVLEHVQLENFERLADRWATYWQPAIRDRAARFANLPSFVPVIAVGAWSDGLYYVYSVPDPAQSQGLPLERLPSLAAVRQLLEDFGLANEHGDHVLNLRPEHLYLRGEECLVLPGAYILPLELLVRAGPRSPYQPPELRQAGLLGPATDGYQIAAVLQRVAERAALPVPAWFAHLQRMQVLEPEHRVAPARLALQLETPALVELRPEAQRRGVERLADLQSDADSQADGTAAAIEALDTGVSQLSEGRSTVVVVEGQTDGSGLARLFLHLRERLCFLNERPRVLCIDPLSAWEPRDLGSGGLVLLLPDWRPDEPELLPLERLLAEKLRPALVVVGVRAGIALPVEPADGDVVAWLARRCGAEVEVRRVRLPAAPIPPSAPPSSAAARHLLDLLCVLETDAMVEMLRRALPQQESMLPDSIVELERLGVVRRQLDAGGWWGVEPRLVLRVLRPETLAARRQELGAERRAELHLLISHLLKHCDARTLGQRYLRFHHLFAGGNWEAAAAECDPLLKGVQRRGLDGLLRQLQRTVVNSNLAQHFGLEPLLALLHGLGAWEVERGRLAEAQSYYERAAERLFALGDTEVSQIDLEGVTDTILAHAILLERCVGFARALELVQRYLDRFGERLPPLDRGRLFSELAYCELRLGRFGAAEERCQVALKLLDPRKHPKDMAQVYNVLGSLRWKTSRYEEAEQYFSTCMALREKTGDKLAMARIYNNLGLLYRSMRRFPEALEYHHRSMQMRQELGDAEGIARSILNLAWVHFEMENLDHADELATRACKQSDELGVPSTRAQAKGLLGEIQLARHRMPEARAALEEAIQQLRTLGDAAELFANLRKYASLELQSGNLARAEELLLEAEVHLPGAGSPLEEANWHLTLAELRRAQQDPRRAALSYEHAGNNLARLGNASRAAEVFLMAARLYHDSGVAARARDLVERARQLYARDGAAVLPKELVELEVELGASAGVPGGASQADHLVGVLCRVAATAASTGSDVQTLEQILIEVRALTGARHAILIGSDRLPHRASVIARDGQTEPPVVVTNQRLLTRALQTVVPFGSEDLHDERSPRPFYVVPVEARERGLGCLVLEWCAGERLPEVSNLQVVRALAQHLAVVLERSEARAARPPAALLDTPPAAPLVSSGDDSGLEAIVGRSAARQAIIDFVRQVRDLDATVLLMGDNGTGKEVVSRAIHTTGVRRDEPFVSINCTAIPAGLWERELFGHERGAFTDAREAKGGYFESAHRGTLLLDEIGDMPWEMQTKFLRVLEEKSFTRIGGTEPVHVDVRIIAATNQDLEAAVLAGRFRRDLYHRLDVLRLTLPPLGDRREDIPELARHFLDLHAGRMGVRPKRLSGEALRILMRYPWPGNVRELENTMKGSLVLSDREVLLPEDLPAAVLRGGDTEEMAGELDLDSVAKWILDHAAYSTRVPLMLGLEKALARQLVAKIGEKTRAARLLGISKPTLYSRLK